MAMGITGWPAALQTEEYHWWRRAMMRDRLPVHDEDPQCGFFKWRNKPVAIWRDPGFGDLRCRIADQDVDVITLGKDWIGISREPVTPAAYRFALEHGEWPGDSKVAKAVATELKSNAPPEGPELLVSQLDELERDADRLMKDGPAKNQARADEAAKLADVIEKIEKTVKEAHAGAKAPHLEAGRTLDRIWFPLRDRASDLKRKLKAVVIAPFLLKDAANRIAENAQLVAQGVDPASISDPRPKASGHSRTTALRTHARAEITGYYELLEHLRDHPAIKGAVETVANQSARAGVTLPGMLIVKEQSAV